MIRATWLGTATLRLDVGGTRVLTDPALGGVGTSHRLGWTPLTGELRYTRLVPQRRSRSAPLSFAMTQIESEGTL